MKFIVIGIFILLVVVLSFSISRGIERLARKVLVGAYPALRHPIQLGS